MKPTKFTLIVHWIGIGMFLTCIISMFLFPKDQNGNMITGTFGLAILSLFWLLGVEHDLYMETSK